MQGLTQEVQGLDFRSIVELKTIILMTKNKVHEIKIHEVCLFCFGKCTLFSSAYTKQI